MSISLRESTSLQSAATQAALDASAKRKAAARQTAMQKKLRDARRRLGIEMGWGGDREQIAIRNLVQAQSLNDRAEAELRSLSLNVKQSFDRLCHDPAFADFHQEILRDQSFADAWNQLWLNFASRLAAFADKTDQDFATYFYSSLRNARSDLFRKAGKAIANTHENSFDTEMSGPDFTSMMNFTESTRSAKIARGELREVGFSTDQSVLQAMPLFMIYGLTPDGHEAEGVWKQAGVPDQLDWLMNQSADYRKHEVYTLMAEQRVMETNASDWWHGISGQESVPDEQFERVRKQTQNKRWQNVARECLWKVLLTPAGWSLIRGNIDWVSLGRSPRLSSVKYWIDQAYDDPQAAVYLLINRLWLFMETPQQLIRIFENHRIRNNGTNNFVRIALTDNRSEQLQKLSFSDRDRDLDWCREAIECCQRDCDINDLLVHLNANFFKQLFLYETASHRNLCLHRLRERLETDDEVAR